MNFPASSPACIPHQRPRIFTTWAVAFVFVLAQGWLQAGNTWTGGGGSNNWSDNSNWGGAAPGYGTLTFSGTTQTTNNNNSISAMNQVNWTGTAAWTMNGSTTLSLFDNGGTQAKLEANTSGGVTINAPITFAANNGSPPNPFGEINAINSNFSFTGGTLTVNGSSVNGIKFWGGNGRDVSFGNTVSASGKWFAMTNTTSQGVTIASGGNVTTGDFYVMNGGTLNLSGGTLTTTAVRLGGDFGTTGNQNQTLGGTLALTPAAGGVSFSSTINAVGGNTSNSLALKSLNTSGTNTVTGGVFLDSDLSVQQSAGGTLAFSTGIFDVKARKLTVDVASSGAVTIAQSLASSLAAGGSLVKQGAGTLTLSNTSNSYTGTSNASLNANGTQIAAGTLAIAGDGSLGVAPAGAYNNVQFTGSGTLRSDATTSLNANRNVSVASGSTATFDNGGNTFTINGIVNGTGGNVASSGAGTTVFTGANTYTGTTSISGGTLQIGNGSTTGSLGTGAVTDNGTLAFNRSNTMTVSNDISGTGNVTQSGGGTTILTGTNGYDTTTISSGTLQVGNGGSTGSLGTGNVTNNGSLVFNRTGNIAVSNAISGSGSVTKDGPNIVTFSTSNSYAGTTSVNSGILRVTANDALGTAAAGTSVAGGATLRLVGASYTTAEALSINGVGVSGLGALHNTLGDSSFAGTVTVATNATIGSDSGTLTLTGGVVKNGTTLTIRGSGKVVINGTGISGASANSDLVVDGGTLVANTASTYNGPTTVQNGGTLVANASTGSSTGTGNVAVDSTSTLSGAGKMDAGANLITMNGALVVGDSTLGVPVASALELKTSGGGSTALGSSSKLYIDLFANAGNNVSNAGAADILRLFGTVTVDAAAGLYVTDTTGSMVFNVGDTWKFGDVSGASVTGLFSVANLVAPTLGSGKSWDISSSGGSWLLSVVSVPEPGRALLMLFGFAGLGLRRRR